MKPGIFIGYINTVGVGTLLKNGFTSLNIKSEFYSNEKNRSKYDYYGNEEYISIKFSKSKYLHYPQVLWFLLKILLKYKYFIFIQGGTLLRKYYDVRLLKLFGKKTIVVFAGCDIRMPENVEKYKWNPCSNCKDDYKQLVNCSINAKKNNLHRIENIFDFIFSPEECAGFIKRKYYSHYFPVDFNFLEKYLINKEEIETESVTIIHAPSSFHIKGTEFIEKAVNDLKLKYPFIIYKRLHNMSKVEVIKELGDADIVIDQMLVGFYGVLAVEAMALRKPVICYIRPDIWENIRTDCPVINANPDNLEEILDYYLKNRQKLKEIGKKSRDYALNYHSPKSAAERMLKVLKEKN